MFKKLVTSAVFAGCAAGLIAAALQLAFVQPVLLTAELYETGQLVHFGTAPAAIAPIADAAGTDTGIDLVRDGLSTLFTVFIYAGYGLMLVAGFALAKSKGHEISLRTGIMWGIGGFIALQFAPAFGLPPELPGTSTADLIPRQIWWAGTVMATALGLWFAGYGKGWGQAALAIILILAPHVIGAPHPDVLTGAPPPELASLFVGRALGVGMAAWAFLGLFTAYFWQKDDTA